MKGARPMKETLEQIHNRLEKQYYELKRKLVNEEPLTEEEYTLLVQYVLEQSKDGMPKSN